MKKIASNKFLSKATAIYMMVAIAFANFPLTALAAEGLSVDIVANGKNSLTLTNPSESFTVALNSQNAAYCEQTSPTASGVSTSASMEITPTHPFYPAVGGSTTWTVTCYDANNLSVSDSVTVSLEPTPAVPSPTIDVVVNGSNGPVTLNSGETFVYTWNSTNATYCEETSPITSGISVAGTSATIGTGHPFYPTVGNPTSITIACTNSSGTVSDTVIVNLANPVSNQVSIDVVANGSNGPLVLNAGETFVYTWNSTNATYCEQTSPISSGISVTGTSASVGVGHPFYPTLTSPTTISITCTNSGGSATDSVVISLKAPANNNQVSVDIVANGSNGPLTLTNGETFVYTWNSTNATYCEFTSPASSGASVTGTSATIAPGHPYYPTVGGSKTFTITCTNSTGSATDSVTVNVVGVPVNNPLVTVDVVANGSDGPVILNNGQPYVYTWNSTNATYCEQTSPISSGISVAGTSLSIAPGHPFYPANDSSVTITIICTNSTSTATDSVIISARRDNGDHPSCPVPVITSALSVSAKVGDSLTYTIAASGSNPTITVGALPAGLTYATSTQTISGTSTTSGAFNVSLSASNPCGTDSKTLTITITADNGGGGGGGGGDNGNGGGRRGGRGGSSRGEVKGEEFACQFIKDYMRRDFNNDPIEVMRLQAFLQVFEGQSGITINGEFDQATFDAVSSFQMKYKDDILTPWGHTAPTGYVYILSLKKINEIYCQKLFPLNEAQANEILAFRALLAGLRTQGYVLGEEYNSPDTQIIDKEGNILDEFGNIIGFNGKAEVKDKEVVATTTGEVPKVGSIFNKGQNLKNLASAALTLPTSFSEGFQCLYEFLLILVVLYVLANVLEDVLNKKDNVDSRKKFNMKWTVIVLGLLGSTVLVYIFNEWCLILPLLVALILSAIWIALRPRHSSINASAKSWRMVLVGRSKTIVNNAKNSAKSAIDNDNTDSNK